MSRPTRSSTSGAGTAGSHQCRPQEIGDGLPLGAAHRQPLPAVRPTTEDHVLLTTQYCGQGNAYVEGTLKGRVTLATSNSITVTGDMVLANGLAGTDMLGLVAANSVEVFHPQLDDAGSAGPAQLHRSLRTGRSEPVRPDGGRRMAAPLHRRGQRERALSDTRDGGHPGLRRRSRPCSTASSCRTTRRAASKASCTFADRSRRSGAALWAQGARRAPDTSRTIATTNDCVRVTALLPAVGQRQVVRQLHRRGRSAVPMRQTGVQAARHARSSPPGCGAPPDRFVRLVPRLAQSLLHACLRPLNGAARCWVH